MDSDDKSLKEEYSDFLKTIEWQQIREEVFKRDDYTCQMCGNKPASLDAHHKTYDYWGRDENGELNHIVTLCRPCHEDVHEFYSILHDAIRDVRYKYGENYSYKPVNKELARDIDPVLRQPISQAAIQLKEWAMLYVVDTFVFSRSLELSPKGDAKLMTTARNPGIINKYIEGLFEYDPYHDTASYWEEQCGLNYYYWINASRYQAFRLRVERRFKNRGKKWREEKYGD